MASTDRHLVVDGSNIATEGRSLPSLTQLDEAVQAISSEFPYESLTVVVDATFAHRIDDGEKEEFEAAILAGEIVTPPAGAIGRGDAFILQVAEKVGGIVLSNDSFQEFHGQHEWLFDQGRLIGGKPIEGVGWVFVERSPVRGPTSRRAVREAGGGTKRSSRGASRSRGAAPSGPAPKPSKSSPPPKRQAAKKASKSAEPTKKQSSRRGQEQSKRQATTEGGSSKQRPSDADRSDVSRGQRQADQTKKGPEPLNNPRTFLSFVAQYSIGDDVEGEVERFSSHGCYVRAAEAQCYLPSRAMGDPPPTRARDVVSQGQRVIVKVESLDANRRGINVVLERAIPADDEPSDRTRKQPERGGTSGRDTRSAKTPQAQGIPADGGIAHEGHPTRSTSNVATSNLKSGSRKQSSKRTAKRGASKKTAADKAPAKATTSDRVKRATAKKAPAKKQATAKKTTKKAPAKKATAKKAPAKKATAKKATKKAAAKKSTTKKAPAKKTAAKKTTKKAAAKKSTTKKAPAKKATAKKTTKKAAKKTAAKKAPAKKTAAKKTTKKAAAKKA